MNALPIFTCMRLKKGAPDRLVYLFLNADGSEERVTLQTIFENTNRVSHVLLKAGIGQGDTFALLMRNCPEFLYALFAALSIGALAVPIDPRSKGDKLAFQIRNTKAKGILAADECMANLLEVEEVLAQSPVVGVLYKSHHQVPVYEDFPSLNYLLETESQDLPNRVVPFNSKAPVQVIHTSGTTGAPKGVVLNADRFRSYGLLNKLIWRYGPDDIPYTGLSLTHGNAQAVTAFPSLARKTGHAVISEKFTKSQIWNICRKHGCTTFSLLGGMMAGIYNEKPRHDDGDNPVRKVISAGTPPSIWQDFEDRFNVRIHEWYASVEGGFVHKRPDKGPIGSFGKPNPLLCRVRIVDENDRRLPPGVRGELISRMTIGRTEVNYLGKERESEEKTRGGWLRSGDICHRDKKGYLYFDFRKGGGLRRQGDFIQPDAIEKVIGAHPSVSEVCVYGVPAASGAPGESDLVAAIAPFEGETVDMDVIRDHCLAHLERNSVPTYVQLVDEIPKTISEKHLPRLLKNAFSPEAENVRTIT